MDPEERMNLEELKAFLTLLMCSDPWPVPENYGNDLLQKFADSESQRHGFRDWIEAYHKL